MADIHTIWDAEAQTADWLISGGDLASGHDLETAVILSLMTDRLAEDDDVLPDFTGDRRGWWGDIDGQELHGIDRVGSRLWLLARSKATDKTPVLADGYIREALQWILDQAIADSIDVNVFWLDRDAGKLGASVTVIRGGEELVARRFEPLWDQFEG